jgi:hypothetical protein
MNAEELPFVLENNPKVLPTFPVVVAQPGMWARAPVYPGETIRT